MIAGETWVILAKRLEQIRKAREELVQPEAKLVYDKHDQASVLTVEQT